MGARPEEIRSEIEETRDRITAEIDELTARYSPGRVASRKASGARDAAVSMRAKVGSGAAGMKQRLALRSSSHHEHSSTCGHLGEGRAGTGQALDVGASHPAAERRGEARRRERGARLRRPGRGDDTPSTPYPADPARRTDPLSYDEASSPSVAGYRPAEQDRPDQRRSGEQREQSGQHGRRKRDLGLAGASIVIGAVGVRTVSHPGRREKDLLAAANSKRPYAWSAPADTPGAEAEASADGGSSSGGLMSGLTSAATRAALKRPAKRQKQREDAH